jgi:Snf7
MKGATSLLGSMNRSMNLPALQRIAMEFEKENDIMDQRQEMMDDAIDDVTGLEDEEEGDAVVQEVMDELGVDLGQAVSCLFASEILHAYEDTCIKTGRNHSIRFYYKWITNVYFKTDGRDAPRAAEKCCRGG